MKKDDAVSPVANESADRDAESCSPPGDAAPVSRPAPSDDKPDGERDRLVWAMEQCGWVQAKAARLLNITPRQMGYALKKYDIEVRRF